MTVAPALLHTARLRLRAPAPALTSAVVDFLRRNARHLAPWDPPQPPDVATPAMVQDMLTRGADAFASGQALRWWLSLRSQPTRVIGSVQLSSLVGGAFYSGHLGYALDAQAQGQGLMHEALEAAIAEAFSPRVNLHRLQAAVRPENSRSLAVLQRLGFAPIGLARRYLFIDGAWRDHLLFDRHNPGFLQPQDW